MLRVFFDQMLRVWKHVDDQHVFSYPSFYRFISKVYGQIKVPVFLNPTRPAPQKKQSLHQFLADVLVTCGDHHQRGGHEAKYISNKSSRAQLAKSLPTL